MIIRLDSMEDGSHRQEWNGELPGVDLIYPEVIASVQVGARIHRLREVITVRSAIRAQLTRPCDRCLKPAVLALEADLYVVIRQRTVGIAAEASDDGEILISVTRTRDDSEVDLTNHIRDNLIVEVPMAIVCHEECKGLCPVCGVDMNEESCACRTGADPRWDSLRSVKS